MSTRLVLIALLVLMTRAAFAQDSIPQKKNVHYFFTVNSGMLAGETRMASITYTLNTVHGVAFGKFRAGLGLGLDSYTDRQTLPMFAQVSYDILGKKNPIFIQAGYGWSHAWVIKPDWVSNMNAGGGKMFNAMIGYRINAGDLNISVAAGYKYQETTVDNQNYYYYDFFRYGYSDKIDTIYERLVFTLGIGWK